MKCVFLIPAFDDPNGNLLFCRHCTASFTFCLSFILFPLYIAAITLCNYIWMTFRNLGDLAIPNFEEYFFKVQSFFILFYMFRYM